MDTSFDWYKYYDEISNKHNFICYDEYVCRINNGESFIDRGGNVDKFYLTYYHKGIEEGETIEYFKYLY